MTAYRVTLSVVVEADNEEHAWQQTGILLGDCEYNPFTIETEQVGPTTGPVSINKLKVVEP